jgi:peptide/nickel transport system substrate-binding protein
MNTFMRSAFMALSLLALGQAAPVLAQDDDATTLSLASTVDNNSFDVGALQIGHRVQYWMPVFDTLLVLDPKMNPLPNLATEFTYNADNTVLNLKLREGVSFTDGAPFNAAGP